MRARVIHADAVIPGDGDPFRDGAVVVRGDGVVEDVGPAAAMLAAHAGAEVVRVRGVVFPGLVNAHTHLELSALRGLVSGGGGFVHWVERLIGVRIEARPEEDDAAIGRAIDELDRAGTAAVGEVTNSLAAVRGLSRRGIGGCVFHEVFGVKLEGVRAKIDALDADVASRIGAWPTDDLTYAPAPHTLYTTHAEGVRALIAAARARGARTTLHFAEHAAERRAIESGDGPVADWYTRQMQLTYDWPRLPLLDFAEALDALAPDVVLVHLTDARPDELGRIAARGAPVVFCPRSNLYIETKLPPLLAARAAGIDAALGTDSLASNASLDVLAEARALADRFPTVPARELVRMATWNGARALGRSDLGRIARGARPGIVAVDGDPGDDACAFLLTNVRAERRWIVRRMGGEA